MRGLPINALAPKTLNGPYAERLPVCVAWATSDGSTPLMYRRPFDIGEALRVVADHSEERRTEHRPTTQPQDDHRRLGAGRIGQPSLQRPRSGVEEAAVHVENGDVPARRASPAPQPPRTRPRPSG